MEAYVHGIQRLDFTGRDGSKVVGINIFCSFADENVDGFRTDRSLMKGGEYYDKSE